MKNTDVWKKISPRKEVHSVSKMWFRTEFTNGETGMGGGTGSMQQCNHYEF
jgi:hypothetical protein